MAAVGTGDAAQPFLRPVMPNVEPVDVVVVDVFVVVVVVVVVVDPVLLPPASAVAGVAPATAPQTTSAATARVRRDMEELEAWDMVGTLRVCFRVCRGGCRRDGMRS